MSDKTLKRFIRSLTKPQKAELIWRIVSESDPARARRLVRRARRKDRQAAIIEEINHVYAIFCGLKERQLSMS